MNPAPPAPGNERFHRPIAFVLSGGASLGAIQVGMLRGLLEAGIRPDLLVGTSVGAVNAAFVARGFDEARLDELEAIWRSLRSADVFTGVGLGGFLRFARSSGTLATERGLRRLVDRHLPESHADLKVPMSAVAVELLTGMPVVFSEGRLREHVLASAAIPSVFPPVTLDGRVFVDGGLAANVPLLQAVRLGARTIIALDVGYPCQLLRPPEDVFASLLYALTLALRHQALGVLGLMGGDRREHTVIYLPGPCPLRAALHDFSHTAELIDQGYRSCGEFLAGLGAPGPGIHGHPHFHDGPAGGMHGQ